MKNSRVTGIAFIVFAFAATSFVFNNCGNAEYQGPNVNPVVDVDNETFLNGTPVQVSGNTESIINNGANILANGFVCIPSFAEVPQVRLVYRYANGQTVASPIASPLFPASGVFNGSATNCSGGTPYNFNMTVPVSVFEQNGVVLSDSSLTDQVFFVETFIPGASLTSNTDLYVPIPGSVLVPNGLSSGFHNVAGTTDTIRYVWYEDIDFLIDGDITTISQARFCDVQNTDVVTDVFVTPAGLFEDVTRVTQSDCPPWILDLSTENIATHFFFNDLTYIGVGSSLYCANTTGERLPNRTYTDLDQDAFDAFVASRELFTGPPCDSGTGDNTPTSFPLCVSAVSDVDGDGWGWENNASCIVATHLSFEGNTFIRFLDRFCQNSSDFNDPNADYQAISSEAEFLTLTARPQVTGFPCDNLIGVSGTIGGGSTGSGSTGTGGGTGTGSGSAGFPACLDPTSDPDGDGFGFENEATCVVSGQGIENFIFNGMTFIVFNNQFCANAPGFIDPNVTFMALDQEGFDALSSLTEVQGPPCNQLVSAGGPFPACTNANTDPDGDGFGFENNQTCVVNGSSTTGNDNTNGSSSVHPMCASASSDPDGDGFGFENNATCIVNGSGTTTGTGGTGDTSGTPGNTATPICQDPSSDPDGDGFGFENNASCIVEGSNTTTDTGGSDDTSDTSDTTDNTTTPICQDATSDPDGDGFGFENNASCIVEGSNTTTDTGGSDTTDNTTTPICQDATSDPDGDGFGFENNATCIVK